MGFNGIRLAFFKVTRKQKRQIVSKAFKIFYQTQNQ